MIRAGQRPRALVLAGLAILGALVWGALAGTTREPPPEDGPRVSDRPVVACHGACGCATRTCTNPDAGACTCCNPVGCHPTEAGR